MATGCLQDGSYRGATVMANTKLEPWTVVSVLLSAYDQKADAVLNECLRYLRTNMDAVIACNTSNLKSLDHVHIKLLAESFDPDVASGIRDKKDLVKSRIFSAMVENLVEEAGQLYECRFCTRLVTLSIHRNVPCLRDRIAVDSRGNTLPRHSERRESWKSEDYANASLSRFGSWTSAFWHVWGRVKLLDCSVCGVTFAAWDLQSCRFHPDVPSFAHNPNQGSSAVGTYHCCGQTAVRFDPWQRPTGCRTRDHCVTGAAQQYLVKYRGLVCGPALDPMGETDVARANAVAPAATVPDDSSDEEEDDYEDDEDEDEEDEDSEEVESRKGSPSVQGPARTGKEAAPCVWDPNKSLRYNQDNLREYERRKMKDIVADICGQVSRHVTVSNAALIIKPMGGIFQALEDNRKASCVPRAPQFPPKASLLAIARFKRASRRAKTTTTTTTNTALGLGGNQRS